MRFLAVIKILSGIPCGRKQESRYHLCLALLYHAGAPLACNQFSDQCDCSDCYAYIVPTYYYMHTHQTQNRNQFLLLSPTSPHYLILEITHSPTLSSTACPPLALLVCNRMILSFVADTTFWAADLLFL